MEDLFTVRFLLQSGKENLESITKKKKKILRNGLRKVSVTVTVMYYRRIWLSDNKPMHQTSGYLSPAQHTIISRAMHCADTHDTQGNHTYELCRICFSSATTAWL